MRCRCGHELAEEDLHACPACGAIADPSGLAEEGLEVNGRRLSVGAWEGELMLRGAAWVAGLHAASMVLAFVARHIRSEEGEVVAGVVVAVVVVVASLVLRLVRTLCWRAAFVLVAGFALCARLGTGAFRQEELAIAPPMVAGCLASVGLLHRDKRAARLLAVLCAVWLVFLIVVAWGVITRPQPTLRWVTIAICPFPPLFCLAALVRRQGREALHPEGPPRPLAPLRTIRARPSSPLALACVGFVALSWFFASLWVSRGMGWVDP